MIMETQVWADVRRLKEVEGLSEREIARKLNIGSYAIVGFNHRV